MNRSQRLIFLGIIALSFSGFLVEAISDLDYLFQATPPKFIIEEFYSDRTLQGGANAQDRSDDKSWKIEIGYPRNTWDDYKVEIANGLLSVVASSVKDPVTGEYLNHQLRDFIIPLTVNKWQMEATLVRSGKYVKLEIQAPYKPENKRIRYIPINEKSTAEPMIKKTSRKEQVQETIAENDDGIPTVRPLHA